MATPGLFQLLADPQAAQAQREAFQLQQLLVNPSQIQQAVPVSFAPPPQGDQGGGVPTPGVMPQQDPTPLRGEQAAVTGAGVGVLSPEELARGETEMDKAQQSVGVSPNPLGMFQGGMGLDGQLSGVGPLLGFGG